MSSNFDFGLDEDDFCADTPAPSWEQLKGIRAGGKAGVLARSHKETHHVPQPTKPAIPKIDFTVPVNKEEPISEKKYFEFEDFGITEDVKPQPKGQHPKVRNILQIKREAERIHKEALQKAELAAIAEKFSNKMWRLSSGFYLIQDESGALRPFKLRAEQREFLEGRHGKDFIPKARKLGMSTLLVLFAFDECLFPSQELLELDTQDQPEQEKYFDDAGNEIKPKRSVRCGIIDITETDALDKLSIAKIAWDKGPTEHPDKGMRHMWQMMHKVNPIIRGAKGLRGSDGVIMWQNGCILQAGVRYTGKTPQILHVSELGPISAKAPKVADDIVRGSINAVPVGGYTFIETTMEGSSIGQCYRLFNLAKSNLGKTPTRTQWKLHFFSWLRHPSYIIKGGVPQSEATRRYFNELTEKYGPYFEKTYGFKKGVVPDDRQAWWEDKKAEQGEHMWLQFPTVIEELSRVSITGQIYPELSMVRQQNRVKPIAPQVGNCLVIAGDIGSSNNSSFWLIWPTMKDQTMLECAFSEGKGAPALADLWRKWSTMYPRNPITQILLPHDANTDDKGSGLSYVENLIQTGVPAKMITVVPRTPRWEDGVDVVRRHIPQMWFNIACDTPIKREVYKADGSEVEEEPGGLARLENYRMQVANSKGVIPNKPVKDMCDHAADGLRTFYEGKHHGMVDIIVVQERKMKETPDYVDPFDPFKEEILKWDNPGSKQQFAIM